MTAEYINLSAYKFISLEDLDELKQHLLAFCQGHDLLGTILISPEGINLNLAGSRDGITAFEQMLTADARFSGMQYKESVCELRPFQRMLVKIKKEIITFKDDDIQPEKETVPHLSAEDFKQWMDEGRDITVIDTRNQFEIEYGSFDTALDLGIDRFTEFTEAAAALSDDVKEKPVVIFCTGGVRCEKAGPAMSKVGFKNVYQLDGGILTYFERCGGAHYDGNCFVFDDRVAVDPNLQVAEEM